MPAAVVAPSAPAPSLAHLARQAAAEWEREVESPYFVRVGARHASVEEDKRSLREAFERVIQPIYGDQRKALHQIFQDGDREARLLKHGGRTVGVLVFKNYPVTEDWEKMCAVHDSLEIKSLFVVDPEKDSGKGYGKLLLAEAKAACSELGLERMHVTVNDHAKGSKGFLLHGGFQEAGRAAVRHTQMASVETLLVWES